MHYAKVQAWHETHRAIREAAVIPQGPNNLFSPLARDVRGEERSELLKEASTSYNASAETWRQIPNPSAISPGGFLSNRRPQASQGVASVARQR